jgi:hypothetical protein
MKNSFLYRSLSASSLLSLAACLFLVRHGAVVFALAVIAGASWCILNLCVLERLTLEIFGPRQRRGRLALWCAAKLALYVSGWALVGSLSPDILGLLTGFTLPLAVVALKAAGRAMAGRRDLMT